MWPDSQLELFGLHNSTRNIDMQNQGDIFRGVVSINFVNFKNYRAALSKNVWVQIWKRTNCLYLARCFLIAHYLLIYLLNFQPLNTTAKVLVSCAEARSVHTRYYLTFCIEMHLAKYVLVRDRAIFFVVLMTYEKSGACYI